MKSVYISPEDFKGILIYAYELGNTSTDIKVCMLIEEIKQQLLAISFESEIHPYVEKVEVKI
ncbi:hypothetical protein [Bacillus sp. JJ722]|uniref:hypothetical protein n=1 Tax=Bacillus sp. JJ722 TaxID=3122973 RepID=UPI002FFDA61A